MGDSLSWLSRQEGLPGSPVNSDQVHQDPDLSRNRLSRVSAAAVSQWKTGELKSIVKWLFIFLQTRSIPLIAFPMWSQSTPRNTQVYNPHKETDLETGQRPDCVNVLHCAVICVQPRVRAHDSSQCFAVYTQPNPQQCLCISTALITVQLHI